MKKILSILAICSIITGALVGCDTEKKEGNADSIIGAWTTTALADINSAMNFKEDGIISVITDVTESMYFLDNYFYLSGTAYEYDFNGNQLSCSIPAEEMGITMEGVGDQPIIILNKDEKSDDINGTYNFTGGALYESWFASIPQGTGIYAIVNDDKFYLELDMGEYTYDDETITLLNDESGFFTVNEDGNAVVEYTLSEGKLTTIDVSGVEDVYEPFVID